jgi:hypothetical protein
MTDIGSSSAATATQCGCTRGGHDRTRPLSGDCQRRGAKPKARPFTLDGEAVVYGPDAPAKPEAPPPTSGRPTVLLPWPGVIRAEPVPSPLPPRLAVGAPRAMSARFRPLRMAIVAAIHETGYMKLTKGKKRRRQGLCHVVGYT